MSPSPSSPPSPDRGPGPEAVSPSSGGGFPLWAKLLLGCGLVALVLAIVSGVLIYWGIQRLTRPGRTLEPRQVVSERSVGWVRVEPIVEDPGMSGLVRSLYFVLQRLGQQQQKEDMPEWLRKWYELGQAQQADNPALDWFLPREMTLAFEPLDANGTGGPAEEDPSAATETVAALNLGLLARLIGWLSSMDETGDLREVRGHEVHVGGDQVMAFLEGTLLLTADLEAMERLLERIEGGAAQGAAGAAGSDPTLDALGEGDWDLYGHLDNRRGHFEDSVMGLTEWLGADPTPVRGSVEDAVFRLDVVAADTLEAELTLDVTSEAAAAAWLQALDQHRASLEDEALRIDLDRRATGRRVRAEWKIQGLDEWLARILVRTFEEMEAAQGAELPPEDPTSP